MGEPASDEKPLLKEMQVLEEQLQPGTELAGYEIKGRIGIGGMGAVYRAVDLAEGDEVALKALVTPENRSFPEMLSRFQVQAALLTGLQHASVVDIQDVGRYDDICFLIMPLMLGPEDEPVCLGDYAGWFEDRIDPGEMLQIFDLLLDAFEHFHAHRMVHGNMKPNNVLLQCAQRTDATWQAKIMVSDFGLSRILGADFVVESVRETVRTKDLQQATVRQNRLPPDAKALLQTYDYMSPEQRRGEGASRRSDIFSIGLMFLRMLTGNKVIGFKAPSEMIPNIDADWDAFILKATAQGKDQRYANVQEMRAALKKLNVSDAQPV